MKKLKIGQILRLNLSIPLSIFLGITVIVVVIVYFMAPGHREDIKFVTALLGGASAIYSAYYVGASLRLGIERQRQHASFDILDMLNRPEFVEVRTFLDTEVSDHEQLADTALYEKIVTNVKLYHAVAVVLGIFEDASIAIQQDFVSEDVLYLSISDLVKATHRGLRGFIDQLRKRKAPSSYFIEFDRLCEAWLAGRRLSDGGRLAPLGEVPTHS